MSAEVETHLAGLPEPQRTTLMALRATLRRVLPDAEECLKYSMPAFVVAGRAVAGYDGFKQHCSYFPHSGSVLDHVDLPDWTEASKGTLRFPVDRPLPLALVRRLVRVRLEQLGPAYGGMRLG
ncbi:MAG: DUF1801 domain-containing protein [Acidobacteria bacterium]|nr:DUF1801 domain-containing protein [Acidobacteriota bacterium]